MNEAVRRNLSSNRDQLFTEYGKRLGHLFEAAYESASEENGAFFSPLLPAEDSLIPESAAGSYGGNRPFLCLFGNLLTDADKIAFASFYQEEWEKHLGRKASLSDFPEGCRPVPKRQRVAYVRNPHADQAFARFNSLFPGASVDYCSDFREVCDELDGGYADFGLLPLFSGNAVIGSVEALLSGYGLRIALLFPEGEDRAVFALLCREPVTLLPPTHFRFSFVPENDNELPSLLRAIHAAGCTLIHAGTLRREGTERDAFHLSVLGEEDAFCRLMVYLSLFLPGFAGYGFYSELKERNEI